MPQFDIDIPRIYKGLKYRLREIPMSDRDGDGLQSYDFVPGANEWPAALILPPDIEWEGLSDDWATMRFEVIVLVSAAIDEKQLLLLDMMSTTGARSIPGAFRREPTLGGLVGDVRVIRSRALGYEEQAGYRAYGAVFECVTRIG